MRRSLLFVATFVVLSVCGLYTAESAAPPPVQTDFVQGAVVSGQVMTTFPVNRPQLGYEDALFLAVAPLDKPARVQHIGCGYSNSPREQWAVRNKVFVTTCTFDPKFGERLIMQSPQAWGIDQILHTKKELDLVLSSDSMASSMASPGEIALRLIDHDPVFAPSIRCYNANLPVSRYCLRQFVLTNAKGRVVHKGDTHLLGISTTDTPAGYLNDHWGLTVHCLNWYVDNKTQMLVEKWKQEEKIEVGFKEDFTALGKGADYYFLTTSGKLFRAPKAPPRKPRKLLKVWDDPNRPIHALITDADADRSFLFVGPGKAGEKPAFFVLDEKVKLQSYDPKEAKPSKIGPPLDKVIPFVRVLQAHKVIK